MTFVMQKVQIVACFTTNGNQLEISVAEFLLKYFSCTLHCLIFKPLGSDNVFQ